ncbi:hypothetical protein U0070_006420 [Myodes glareolus]|uniref:Uncharacterized protein n=1 Tax=Myodes glareolus TaxID=447135 RepID=A0AAW0HC96_MYOGA
MNRHKLEPEPAPHPVLTTRMQPGALHITVLSSTKGFRSLLGPAPWTVSPVYSVVTVTIRGNPPTVKRFKGPFWPAWRPGPVTAVLHIVSEAYKTQPSCIKNVARPRERG